MDKKVAISVSVDEAQFSRAKQKLSEITAEIKKIADLTKGLDLGGLFSGVGTRKRQAGTGNNTAARGAAAAPNVSLGGVENLAKSAQAFRQAGDSAKTALKGMSDAFKEHVGVSSRESKRLLQEMGELEKGFDRLSRKAKGMGGGGDFTANERSSISGPMGRIFNRGGGGRGDLTGAELASIQSPMGRAMGSGFWNKSIPGTPEMPGGSNSFLARGLGIKGGPALGVLGPLAAIATAVNYGMEQRNVNQMANLGYQANHLPFLAATRSAAAGQFFGGNALAIKQGDFARSMALSSLGKDRNFMSLIGDQRMNYQKMAIDKTDSTSFWQNPTFGNARSQFRNWVGGGASRMTDFLGGAEVPGLAAAQANEIRNRIQKDFISTRGTEDLGKMLDLKMQQDPVNNALMNSVWSGASGNLGLSRAAGISGGLRWKRGRGGMQQYDTVSDFNAAALRTGFGGGEIAGQMMQTMAASGRRGGVGTAASLMNAGFGGLSNATNLYGQGAQFGAGGFYGGFQGLLGAGGVGGVAGSQLGSLVMNGMNGGNFTGFSGPNVGLGFAGVLADATMTGNASTDIRQARKLSSGLNGMNNMMSGALDPLQQALNYSAAMSAMPGSGFASKKALMDMDAPTRMEILRSGKVPEWMRESGVGLKDVQSYVGAQGATALSRISDPMVSGTGLEGALGRYRKSGGLDYLRGMKGGDRDTEISRLSRLFNMSGMESLDGSEMMIRLGLGEKGIGRRARGRGVGAGLDYGSNRMQVLRAQAGIVDDEGKALVDQKDAIADEIGRAPANARAQDRSREIAQRGAGGSPEEALASVQVALSNFVNSLRQMPGLVSGPVRAKPPIPAAR